MNSPFAATSQVEPARRIKTALFVDFDNIYVGLDKIDPEAAQSFATYPARWLAWIEHGMPSRENGAGAQAQQRAILIRRCYLNPKLFYNFRPYFTRSAFSVVDCPPITQRGKNSTDIQMVMDILDLMNHPTRFDEFILPDWNTYVVEWTAQSITIIYNGQVCLTDTMGASNFNRDFMVSTGTLSIRAISVA